MAIFENKSITHYIADTSQEIAAIEGLIRKNDQLKKAEADAAKEREQHFDQLVLDISRTARAEDELTQKQTTQAAVAKKSFGEMATDLARLNLVFGDLDKLSGFAVKSLNLLGAELSTTTKETVNATAKGAQMGAAFGALGAAIGAAGGALGEFLGDLYDNGRTDLVIKNYEAMVYQSDRLSAAYRQITADLDNWTSAIEKQRYEQEKTNRALLDSATGSLASAKAAADDRVNTLKVAYLTEKRFVEEYGGSNDQLLTIARQLRDAQTEQSLAFKDYGADVIKIREEEQHRFDTIARLNRALAEGAINQKQYQKALADLDKEEAAAAKRKAEEYAKIGGKLLGFTNENPVNRALREGASDRAARQADIDRMVNEELAVERARNAPYGHWQDNSTKVTEILGDPELQKMLRDLQEAPQRNYLETIFGPIEQVNLYQESIETLGSVFSAFSDAVGAGYEALVTGAEPLGQAFKKAAAASLLATGKTSAIDALRETALGFGSLALGPIGGVSAAGHFKAAALHAGVAVAAGVAASALGAGGGGSTGGGTGGGGGSGGAGGRGGTEIVNAGGTGRRSEQNNNIVVVYADPFAEGTAGTRRRNAKKVYDRARGGQNWEDS
jgi:hypothetical protein